MSKLNLPDLGVGVGLRGPHHHLFAEGKPSTVNWIEVISENYMDWENTEVSNPIRFLEKVRSSLPVVLHGVSLSLGSVDPLSQNYLQRLKRLVDRIEPAWVSDHVCWTGVNGQNLHDLYPLPFHNTVVSHVAQKIDQVQNALGRRILVENVSSYLTYKVSELTEWEFLTQICERSDCGLLLDINNIYVSSVNHGFDPLEFICGVPKERVVQIHLAGHSKSGKILIDTHDAPVCEEVWGLYQKALKHFGLVSTMIERDAQIPDWSELEVELKRCASARLQETESLVRKDALGGLAKSNLNSAGESIYV